MCIQNARHIPMEGKPITVYKVVLRCNTLDEEDGIRYETPFRGVTIEKDILRGERPFEAGRVLFGDNPSAFGTVNSGYIHTYADKYSAIKDYRFYYRHALENNDRKVEIYECEVPATEDHYWYGVFDDDSSLECVGAKKIVFKRKLPQEEIDKFIDENFSAPSIRK